MKARNKAKLAEETSDLNTADEGNKGLKRKRIQKMLSSSDDSAIESQLLPSPPRIKKNRTKAGNHK